MFGKKNNRKKKKESLIIIHHLEATSLQIQVIGMTY